MLDDKGGLHLPCPSEAAGSGLLQLQMIISFPVLRAKNLRTSLLIMRTCSFLISCK